MYELLGYIAICSCKYFTYESVYWCYIRQSVSLIILNINIEGDEYYLFLHD